MKPTMLSGRNASLRWERSSLTRGSVGIAGCVRASGRFASLPCRLAVCGASRDPRPQNVEGDFFVDRTCISEQEHAGKGGGNGDDEGADVPTTLPLARFDLTVQLLLTHTRARPICSRQTATHVGGCVQTCLWRRTDRRPSRDSRAAHSSASARCRRCCPAPRE